MRPPAYIEQAEIIGSEKGLVWKGPRSHKGPVEGTALHALCYKLCKLPAVFLTSLLADWAAWRLSAFYDPQTILKQAHAVRAWQVDERYYIRHDPDYVDEPLGASVESSVLTYLFRGTEPDVRRVADSLPNFVVHQAFTVRHTLPKKSQKAFDQWFQATVNRLIALCPRPKGRVKEYEEFSSDKEFAAAHRPYLGLALPPEAGDPEYDFSTKNREELLDRYLQSLDWRSNEFLRSPEELKAAGFEGKPYRLA